MRDRLDLICGMIAAIVLTLVMTFVPYGVPWLDPMLEFIRNCLAGCGLGWLVSQLVMQRRRKLQDQQMEEVFAQMEEQVKLLINQHNQGVKPWEIEEEPKIH